MSTDGGSQPVWSPDGRQLYWTDRNNFDIWGVDVTSTDGRFVRSRPRMLVDAPPGLGETGPIGSLDVSPVDGRFVGLWAVEAEPQPVTQIEVVQNWFEELKRLVPAEGHAAYPTRPGAGATQ